MKCPSCNAVVVSEREDRLEEIISNLAQARADNDGSSPDMELREMDALEAVDDEYNRMLKEKP
jgi:hypothetical protein